MKKNEEIIDNRVLNAFKWSTIAEVVSKLASPISSIILARLLAPEAFGIVATVVMIISFIDMFIDGGFQKYLVQYDFKNDSHKNNSANVAFWTNFILAFLLWIILAFYSNDIASLVGNPGMGIVIIVACIQLPLSSFSSIQMALYKRNFDFKTLFMIRLYTVSIPFIVTVPLALLGFSHWSIIIGNLCVHFINAVILNIKSKWKPRFFFDFKLLGKMFSFSMWTLAESISIWITTWVDSFIISTVISAHYLGLYKTSTTMVNSLLAIITASVVPVLFSALSRLQYDNEKFNLVYFRIQRLVALFVMPLGAGAFLYRDFVTFILLGDQWNEASDIVGIWALTSSIVIIFGHFCSEAYRAKGKPKLSLIAQVAHLIVLIPACLISVNYGFWTLIITRSLIRFQVIIVHLGIMKFKLGMPILKSFTNVIPVAVSTILMTCFGFMMQKTYSGLAWTIASILVCILIYFSILLMFISVRIELKDILTQFSKKNFQVSE